MAVVFLMLCPAREKSKFSSLEDVVYVYLELIVPNWIYSLMRCCCYYFTNSICWDYDDLCR